MSVPHLVSPLLAAGDLVVPPTVNLVMAVTVGGLYAVASTCCCNGR